MSSRTRILISSVLIMAGGMSCAVAITVAILYETTLEDERADLGEIARGQAHFMEAVARFDMIQSQDDHSGGARASTMSQIAAAHQHYPGFGETGELVVAQREGEQIVFLFPYRHGNGSAPDPVPWRSELAEPMRRALSGQKGTLIGLDYRGERVLAAYYPVAVLNLGVVAKSDLAEVRAPFVTAGVVATVVTVLLVLVGAGLTFRVTDPLVRQLEESKAWLSTTLKSIGDGVIVTNPTGSVRFMNPVAEVLTGWNQDDAIGKPLSEVFVIINERTGQRADNPITRVLAEGVIAGLANHTTLISKDGTERAIDDSGAPLKDNEGHVAGAVLIFRDVTERRRAEEATRIAQELLLEQQRGEKERVEAKLEKARAQLVTRTRLETIGQVSASVAHELRNPLGAVRNAAYLLKRHVPHNEEKRAEYLGIIDEEVNRADRTIRNLMEMARPKEPMVQQVDLAEMAREAFDLTDAPEGVRFRTSLGVEPFLIHVDLSQLRQVLINLLANAAQAMSERGEIIVEATHENGYDSIIVRDSGPGVPPEHRGQLFDPLFSTKAKGTGLGLTICRQIIEQHGGAIEFVEADEGGAAFEIRLPSGGAPEPSENGEAICQHGKRSQQEHRF